MKLIDNIKSHFDGKEKALRDINLAKMFWEEHGGKPGNEVSHRFFTSLGDDVDESNKWEVNAYKKDVARYQKEWRAELGFPERPQGAVEVYTLPAPLMVALMTGTLTEEMIDDYAKEHGHFTRDEECPPITHLRHMLGHQNGQG
jgi:hypothetical protein